MASTLAPAKIGAQDDNYVPQLWEVFFRECGAFISDPQSYADALPVPGAVGEQVFYTTEDRSTTVISTAVGNWPIYAFVFVAGDRLDLSCSVGTAYQQAADLAATNYQMQAVFDDLDAATVVGGFVQHDFVYAEPSLALSRSEPMYIYNVVGLFDDPRAYATATIGEWSISLTAGAVQFREADQ